MNIKYLVLMLLFWACKNPNGATESQIEEDKLQLSPLAENVLGDQSKVFRGYDFNNTLNDVKTTEKLDELENHPNSVIYTFETPNLETVDILYTADAQQKLESIKVDIYLNEEADNEELYQSFKNYFSKQYQVKSSSDSTTIWTNDQVKVELNKVNNYRDIGLSIIFDRL